MLHGAVVIDREEIERRKREMQVQHGYDAPNDKGRVLQFTPRSLGERLGEWERRAKARDSEVRLPEKGGFTRMMRHAKSRFCVRRKRK